MMRYDVHMNVRESAHALLRANRRTTSNGHEYTVPSPTTYPYQWLWDSCFHIIVLAKLEPEMAIKELKALLSRQFADGMLPHMIFWNLQLIRPYHVGWGVKGTSSITQPPMIAYAAWEIYKHTKDETFLRETFPAMFAFYRYLIQGRDPRDNHLVSIINPDESGEDNSPRFDAPMHLNSDISFFGHMYERHKLMDANRVCKFDVEICTRNHFWVKDVPFNAILVRNLEILIDIAVLLGEKEAETFARLHLGLVKDAMRELLFEDGVFWSATGEHHSLLKVHTWAHFAPLFANLYTPEEAKHVIRTHFDNPNTFRSSFGIRTVSKQEPSYRPRGFWRGPIWFATQWFLYHGLNNYGYTKEAEWIRDTTHALVQRHGFREYFNPEDGKAYGAYNFTWGTLVLDMMES